MTDAPETRPQWECTPSGTDGSLVLWHRPTDTQVVIIVSPNTPNRRLARELGDFLLQNRFPWSHVE